MGTIEDQNEGIDYDFFDDKDDDKSEKDYTVDHNAKLIGQRDRSNIDDVSIEDASSNNSEKVLSNSSQELDGESSISSKSSINSLKRSSENSSPSNHKLRSRDSLSPQSARTSSIRSSSPIAPHHRLPSESDVTVVSSLDSEPQNNDNFIRDTRSRGHSRGNANVTHIDDPDDVDRVKPEAILRAMIRIHEERRAMRQSRPKWVDPNTKDYSVSGITTKMNLVPERMVSSTKKNMRDNPFYCQHREPFRRPYHTALNRVRELERIEKENMTIYDRLKKVQPSPGITKRELLKDYTKVNRFSLPPNFHPLSALTSTYQTLTSTNSRSSSQVNRTQSSASTHKSKSEVEQASMSSRYSHGRVMSASSLRSTPTRPNTAHHQKRLSKK